MGNLIAVSGRTLTQSEKSHQNLAYTITETDVKTVRTFGHGKEILINQIKLSCTCSGDYVAGTSTFSGKGEAAIVANSKRVKCEGQSILLEGDEVTITCEGTITDNSSGATAKGTATVTVKITDSNQKNIFTSKT
ncbi:MAG: hypothetical protein DWB56_04990 [Candidatus Jettenia sp.]|uniref:Uncharacterized protein n=1 Tax=Candidatus Jettenia caeni TaxID=247490 RepID=I3IIA5_9BACT|nr:hypothetical protein [Candidatus Jettenia sp. AMX1]MBC6928311.1 hypothetical protein [Candidatus Jettenia sp.]NUN21974.1 hypothetical protein [Candidatus Jettenia caeni]KAA0249928.1 MAG: hypothetical protein EDM77_06585 [Candidatus Jettenia sp. AMX1]MCE7880406.1 hypothetical protein [Candidatus Jettenia sp. AMX1]MCQ3926214.1 hypothetical protein [Candidatus Jettenia sp.]